MQHGSPAGDLRDFQPHELTAVITGCIPKSGNPAITRGGGLPFPVAVATRTIIQLQH